MNNDSGLTFGFVVLAILGITVRIVIPLAGVIIGFVLVKNATKNGWFFQPFPWRF